MSEEQELNISGRGPIDPPGDDVVLGAPDPGDDTPHRHTPDLSKAAEGVSDEQLVDVVMGLPEDAFLPWETCVLPSDGFYYGWPNGQIEIRPMGLAAERVLVNRRLAASGQSFDYLYQACCRFPANFSPTELLLGDRMYLLYVLRGITHGNNYEFMVTCGNPDCQEANNFTYDLNDLQKTINWANKSLGYEPFKVKLPYLSESLKREFWVGVRFLRSFDANNMVAMRKTKSRIARPNTVRTRPRPNQRQATDPRMQQQVLEQAGDLIDQSMERIVVSVMGVQDPMRVRQILNNLHSRDRAAIREWMRQNTPGIDSSVLITCPSCGTEFPIELPISEAFFRPTEPGGDGS